MAGERVVFLGNCQAYALALAYRGHFAPDREQVVHCVDAQQILEPTGRKHLEEADIIVVQQFDFPSKVTAKNVRSRVKLLGFPMVTGGWLWPYGGQAHPRNEPLPSLPSGPYPDELGDRFLNRMILQGVNETEALERYLALDIVRETSLDRLVEMQLRRQRARDQETGFDIAGVIETHFSERRLFLTPSHYNLRIFGAMARGVFSQFEISQTDIDTVLARLRATPFPTEELPLHPAVAAHYGIEDAGANERYSFRYEGTFTFTEYVRRYMRCEWNSHLQEGIFLSGRAEPNAAFSVLQLGLATSPRAIMGHRTTSAVLTRIGRHDEAEAAARRAITLDCEDPESYVSLARALAASGRLPEAEVAARMAVRIAPEHAASHRVLAEIMGRGGHMPEAVQAARDAVRVLPGDARSQSLLGDYLTRTGDFDGAVVVFRRAVKCGGAPAAMLPWFAEALAGQHRYDDAARELRAGLDLDPDNTALHRALGRMLARQNDFLGAETSLRNAIALEPDSPLAHQELGALFARQGRWDQAIGAGREAVRCDPSNPQLHSALGHYLLRKNDVEGAEPCFRAALCLAPSSPGFRRQLASLLLRSKRFDEALTLVELELALQPEETGLLALAADVLEQRGDFTEAETFLRRAVMLEPGAASLHRQLSGVLARRGLLGEARTELQAAVALGSNDPGTLASLGRLFTQDKAFAEAEACFRQAIEACPDRAGFHHELATTLRVQGRLEEAVRHAKVALKLDTTNAHLHFAVGHLLALQGDHLGAREYYERSAQLEPSTPAFQIALQDALSREKQALDRPAELVGGSTSRRKIG